MTHPAIPLYPYQQRWFRDRSRFKIGMFARQTGKTFTTTLEIVDSCFEAASQGGRERWVILSRGERQAKEAMDEGIKLHAKAYGMAIEELEYQHTTSEGASYKALEVVLPNGSRITALPANPDTARGFSANVFLDEFAFHKDSRQIWRALFPVISKGGLRLRITSTPNGKANKFYDLLTAEDDVWSRHITDIHQAIADGLPRDAEQLRTALNDEDAWRQEFLLEWLDEASAWLDFELISSCEAPTAGKPEFYEPRASQICFIGNDIARRKHLWVAWVLESIGDVLWTREVSELRGATFAEQDAELDRLMAKYRVSRVAIDQTGLGEKPVEDAKGRYGEYRVDGVLFSSVVKQHLATLGKQKFEDRKLRIPMGNSLLREDLHSLRKVVTPAGNVRFDVEGEGESHADRAWALFLAIYAASNPSAPIEYRAVGEAYGGVEAFEESAGGLLVPSRSVGFGSVGGTNFSGF